MFLATVASGLLIRNPDLCLDFCFVKMTVVEGIVLIKFNICLVDYIEFK